MVLDWNWFFSTLSQSTAAIVGIVGAFIIAKIFSNQTTFTEKCNKIKTLSIEAHKVLDKVGTIEFEWYSRVTNESAFTSAESAIVKLNLDDPTFYTDEIIDKIYEDAQFSIFTDKEEIVAELHNRITRYYHGLIVQRRERERAERARQSESRLSGISGFYDLPPIATYRAPVFDSTPWPALNKEFELITECHLESKHLARVVGGFLESVKGNPESPPQITWSLIFVAFIFLAGVIYPLTFMPSGTPPTHALTWPDFFEAFLTIKGALLSLLSLAFLLIVGMFTWTNLKMRYDLASISELEHLSDADNYCPYFKFLSDEQ